MDSTYKTSQIAKIVGIHPNTVRLYEELGYLPPVPRAGNGYRLYNEVHLQHLLLIRSALKSTWLGGVIRRQALQVLTTAASGDHDEAVALALEHLALVRDERIKAQLAAQYLEDWATSQVSRADPTPGLKSSEAVSLLDITNDMLRSWERNGLITIPRDPDNSYRIFGPQEIRRLYVIRALRKARFSLLSIHNMFQRYDAGVRDGLTGILDDLPAEAENIFYNTDQWLSKIKSIEESALDMVTRLNHIQTLKSKPSISAPGLPL